MSRLDLLMIKNPDSSPNAHIVGVEDRKRVAVGDRRDFAGDGLRLSGGGQAQKRCKTAYLGTIVG